MLLFTDPANMNYLTGYDGWSFYVHQMVALSLDESEPSGLEANGWKWSPCHHLSQRRKYPGLPGSLRPVKTSSPHASCREIAKSRGWHKKRIGVEMEAYYFTAGALAALRKKLPKTRFKDADHFGNWVRIVKSRKELEYMTEAARILERMMRVAIDNVRPGIRQCDAAAEIWRAGVAGTRQYGGDYPSIPPMLPTGAGLAAPHLTWSDEKFKRGEGTALELAGVRHRYQCPMARTVFLGKATQENARFSQSRAGRTSIGSGCNDARHYGRRSRGRMASRHQSSRDY
ncbi:MAG: hypothetical protein CM1200mP41_19710 [Gammaproteobacteria bacterium]|nr:MAG: hypothetical protein CM1200mP41_19710 [Gammaproteobacteria bacterium]